MSKATDFVEVVSTARSKSSTKRGDEWEGNEQWIDSSSLEIIPSEDEIILHKDQLNGVDGEGTPCLVGMINKKLVIGYEGDTVELRHINGYASPFKKEQDAANKKPTDIDSVNYGQDDIKMEDGGFIFDIKNNPYHVSRWNYLKISNYNSENKFRNKVIVPSAMFKILDNTQISIKLMDAIDRIDRAKEHIEKIRLDKKGTKFNQPLVDLYTQIFLSEIGGLSSNEEKYIALYRMVQADPDRINNMIEKGKAEYYGAINTAFKTNLLVIDGDHIKNTASQTIEYKSEKGKLDAAKALDELLYFYSSPTGAVQFKTLQNQIEAQRN